MKEAINFSSQTKLGRNTYFQMHTRSVSVVGSSSFKTCRLLVVNKLKESRNTVRTAQTANECLWNVSYFIISGSPSSLSLSLRLNAISWICWRIHSKFILLCKKTQVFRFFVVSLLIVENEFRFHSVPTSQPFSEIYTREKSESISYQRVYLGP